jgi:colicin import membrane protein
VERLRRAQTEIRDAEHAALAAGSLRVADLWSAAHWEAGARIAEEAAEASVSAAKEQRRASEESAEERRRATAQAQANADAVEQLLQRAEATRRAKLEAAAEEAAEEANLARRRRADRGEE